MNESSKNIRQFVFEDDKSDLEVERYESTNSQPTVAFFVPSENAWIIYRCEANIYMIHSVVFGLTIENIFGPWHSNAESGVVQGNNALIFRLMIRAQQTKEYGFEYLLEHSELFKIKSKENEMPRVALKEKVKAVDLQKKSGVLQRSKQLVAFFNEQSPDSVANVRQIAEYLNGLHDEADPAPIIQCTSSAISSKKRA